MVRKLALAVSFALGTLSVPAHALGLGEISSKSHLNQNFQGDISLLSVQPEELDAVRVTLADAEAFSRAGVDRPFYLSLLKFEPTLSARGKPVIRVTSEFPIREPFMNFLIEVNWPNGRLLREYTVLLDPPTTTTRRPPAVAPAARVTQAEPVPKPVAPARVQASPAAPTVSSSSSKGSEYGPVKANETAWSIAQKVRPRGVSMEQMMIALLNANPQAFLENNINRLRKGQILRVPALAEIQELSRQEARAVYRQQQDEWLARRDQKLQQAAEAEAPAQTDATAGAAAAAEAEDQLRIATARPEGSGEAGAGDDDALTPTASDLKSRLMVARENAETSRQEAETLRSRVDDLQARLQDMQRLLSLKDEQLAQLQDRVASGETIGTTEMPPFEAIAPEAGETLPTAEEQAGVPNEADSAPPAETVEVPVEAADQAPVAAEEVVVEGAVSPGEAVQAAAEAEIEVPAETQSAVAVAEDYRIADIAPQVDPDRIVALSDAAGVVPEGALDLAGRVDAEPFGSAEPAAPGEGEVVVIEEGTGIVIDQTPAEPVAAVESAPAEPRAKSPLVAPEAVEPPVAVADTTGSEGDALIPAPLMRMLEQNMLPIAAGGVAVLGLFGWLAMRGRRKTDGPAAAVAAAAIGGAAATAAASVEPRGKSKAKDKSAAEVEPQAAPVDQPAVDADTLAELPDSAFLDEFSPSDINALQDETGEVDPVSEADVYIAYGRYQQAEELLRQAMNRDPDRLALKHKLLEVHYATRNADAFAAVAQEMVDAGQDTVDAAAWLRAQDMGRELAPDNALFNRSGRQGGVAVAAAAGAVAGAVAATFADTASSADDTAEADTVDDDTMSLEDLEMSELTSAYAEEASNLGNFEAPSEVSITLDLDEASELAKPTEPSLPETLALDDFESVDFEMPQAEAADVQEPAAQADELAGDTLDLENMMAEAEAAVDQDESMMNLDSDFSAAELQAQLDELSDLSLLDANSEDATDEPRVAAAGSLGLVAEDAGATDLGVDEPFSLDSELTSEEGEDDLAEIFAFDEAHASNGPVASVEAASGDEVATKLDLARAYVDMGDDDGARSILEEVVVEGNDSQRGDAEQLLAKIG